MAKTLKEVVSDRLEELGRNPFEAARVGGFPERGYVNDILIDKKEDVRAKNLERLAKGLDWSLIELRQALGEEGAGAPNRVVRVMGKIGAGAEILPEAEQVGPDGLYEIELAFAADPRWIAFEVEGNSMWPRYDEGDVIVCVRDGLDVGQITKLGEAAVRTADGKRYLKNVLPGSRRGHFDLVSFNAPTLRDVRLAWASEVHNVIRAGQWKKMRAKSITTAVIDKIVRKRTKASPSGR